MPEIGPWSLKPRVREVVWGGRWLETELGRPNEGHGLLGESWEAYSESLLLNGAFAGATLGELFRNQREALFGVKAMSYPGFPLLVKFIDAHQNLSVQVHPDNELAQKLENYPYGKTEYWYILEAAPGAQIVYGLTSDAPDREQLKEALQTGEFLNYCARVPVQKGDVVFIPAGTVHALTEGVVVYELQQESDITYRLYDWGRTSREIHIDKGVEAIDLSYRDMQISHPALRSNGDHERVKLAESPYFQSDLIRVDNTAHLPGRTDSFRLFSILDGWGKIEAESGDVDAVAVKRGDTLFLPIGPDYRLTALDRNEPLTAIESALA